MNAVFNRLQGDRFIWLVVALLSLISLLVVYSATSGLARRYQDGNTEYYFIKHAFLMGVALIVMYGVHKIDYRFFAKISFPLVVLSAALLVFAFLQGKAAAINDANRWITIFGQSFQPSDLAKFSVIIYLAKIMTRMKDNINDYHKVVLPILLITGFLCGIIAPANLSTAVMLFLTSLAMMFIAGVRTKLIAQVFGIGLIGLVLLILIAERSSTWEGRIKSYIGIEDERAPERRFQANQSSIAIATGGLFGNGAGKSVQRNILPHPYSDFVFAIIVEEYGAFGGLFVLILYLTLMFRTISIVRNSRTFGALLAAGLSILIVGQALINIGVNVGLLPVTGLTLPLVSMGGTSMIFTAISIGIIISISRGIPAPENTTEHNVLNHQPA